MTQLSFDDLMTDADAPVFKREHFPNVDNITVPFEWARVDYLLGLRSVDFPEYGPNAMASEYNRRQKRSDGHYEDLLEDLELQGFLDPIYVHARGERDAKTEVLGNGHHRLVAAYDLGYTYVPVTRERDDQWRDSGRGAR
jgi:hypothetical protein